MNGDVMPVTVHVASELLKTFNPLVEETLATDLLPTTEKSNRFTVAKLMQIERRRRKATKVRRGYEYNR